MPYLGELESIRDELTQGASVLELGCGAGRITRRLLELGTVPTSVDNSPEMLAHVPQGGEALLGDLRTLRLGRKFERVLLASGFLNHPDPEFRDALIRTCSSHLSEGGRLLVERVDADWLSRATEGRLGRAGPMESFVAAIAREGAQVSVTMRYVAEDGEWTHSFSVMAYREPELEALLRPHGYRSFTWHGRGRWLSAGF